MNDKKSASDNGHFSQAYSLETAEQTLEHYKDWAATYDQEVGVENAYAQPLRVANALLDRGLGKNADILDAGCGSGLSGEALKNAGFKNIDGCDFSPEMLKQARGKDCYRKLWQADLNEGQPQIANHSYDAVTAVGIFSFGHLNADACDDLIRILKPGGLLVIALNEQYWDKGDLAPKLDSLIKNGQLEMISKEYGDHLPGHKVNGWVIVTQMCH